MLSPEELEAIRERDRVWHLRTDEIAKDSLRHSAGRDRRALVHHIASLEEELRELKNAGSDLLAIYRDGYCEGDYAADVANRLDDASASARRLLGEEP